jgi:hypothetical protein
MTVPGGNALAAREVTEAGSVTAVIAVPSKACSAMTSTLFPIVTEDREKQRENAPSRMVTTELGITIEVIAVS